MVAEGEDWKSVEVPAVEGSAVEPATTAQDTEESEKPSGGNSTCIHIIHTIFFFF